MEGFFDSANFRFEELTTAGGHTYMTPVHHRELGEKKNELYSPSVSWADVAINGVPLEQTFQFQDDILRLENESDHSLPETYTIMVNSRPSQPLMNEEDVEEKRWMKRLEKLYPMNFQEAKNKRKSVERYPVKPKNKKETRQEKIYSSASMFKEITDEKHGIEKSLDYTIYIQKKDDFEIVKGLDYMNRPSVYKRPIRTKYCPPLHWLEPEVKWVCIWSHLDELRNGKKRDYHFYPEGDEGKPCIYFYDKSSDDLNYGFDWSKDFMNVSIYFGGY